MSIESSDNLSERRRFMHAHNPAAVFTVFWHVSGARIGLFPDTVSERAQRHVRELIDIVASGKEAAVCALLCPSCLP